MAEGMCDFDRVCRTNRLVCSRLTLLTKHILHLRDVYVRSVILGHKHAIRNFYPKIKIPQATEDA